MNVFMINSGYDGCCYLRIYLPCIFNGYWTDKPSLVQDKVSISEIKDQLANADVVVFHRAEGAEYHNLAKMLKKDGKKIVMDNDDTFRLDDYHPLANFDPEGHKQDNLKIRSDNIDSFIKMCDLVTTTTETLAKEYRENNDNVIILPNYVDPDDWEEPKRNNGEKIKMALLVRLHLNTTTYT